MTDRLSWAMVTLVLGITTLVLASIVVLAIVGADTSVILSAVSLLGMGGGLGVLLGIKSNVNGNLSKLVDYLSQAQPVPPDKGS
jgi:hypothetical protein